MTNGGGHLNDWRAASASVVYEWQSVVEFVDHAGACMNHFESLISVFGMPPASLTIGGTVHAFTNRLINVFAADIEGQYAEFTTQRFICSFIGLPCDGFIMRRVVLFALMQTSMVGETSCIRKVRTRRDRGDLIWVGIVVESRVGVCNAFDFDGYMKQRSVESKGWHITAPSDAKLLGANNAAEDKNNTRRKHAAGVR